MEIQSNTLDEPNKHCEPAKQTLRTNKTTLRTSQANTSFFCHVFFLFVYKLKINWNKMVKWRSKATLRTSQATLRTIQSKPLWRAKETHVRNNFLLSVIAVIIEGTSWISFWMLNKFWEASTTLFKRLQKKNKCDKKRLIENWRLFSLLDITWFTYQNILVSCLTDIALGNLGKKKTKYYVTMWLIPIWRLEVIVS